MRFYSTDKEEFFVKRDKLKEYEYIHYHITQNFSANKFERDVIEIEIDGESVCRLPLLILCANYLSFEALGKVEEMKCEKPLAHRPEAFTGHKCKTCEQEEKENAL